MIYDRTEQDVLSAIELKKRLQSGDLLSSLDEDDVKTLERGTLTISTLNRIEGNCEQLVGLFRNVGYYMKPLQVASWSYEDYFKQSDFDRILSNIDKLRNAFYVYSYTPKTPGDNYRKFQIINDVEKILHDLHSMVQDIVSHYRQCGTFQCAEVN